MIDRRNTKQKQKPKQKSKDSEYSRSTENKKKKTLNPEKMKIIDNFDKLLSRIQANKVRKMVASIRQSNPAFNEYFNENRIVCLKIEDFSKFIQNYDQNQSIHEQRKKKPFLDYVNIGFVDLKKKMQEFQVTDFISQVGYTNLAIQRQIAKLNKLGNEYQGLSYIKKPFQFIQEMKLNEKQNGLYSCLNPHTITKAQALYRAEQNFFKVLADD